MKVRCVRVDLKSAEKVRKNLLLSGHLRTDVKILSDEAYVYLPLKKGSHYSSNFDILVKNLELHKKKVILSVARFETEGTKRQREMIQTFLRLKQESPKIMEDWSFVLVGGSDENNPYLQSLENLVALNSDKKIHLKINIPVEELRSMYRESSIFWHVCGLVHRDPSEIEHFGMTTVEAMQNACVPVVFRGGGQVEIVRDRESGYLFSSLEEAQRKTLAVLTDPGLAGEMGARAYERGLEFRKEVFLERIRNHFSGVLDRYSFKPGSA